MSRMWRYTLVVLVLWVINPELRRLYDWRFGFSELDILAVLPLVSLVPHIWSLTFGGGWQRLPRPVTIAAWLWLGGFTYALVLGVVSGNLLAAVYGFANYVFPVAVALWVAADATDFRTSYRRLTRVLFALTTFVSVYGIFQYAFAPIWDVVWLQNVIAQGSLSFGRPEPFAIRVFSTLNSPGPFAFYLAMVLLLALPQLSLRRPAVLLQMPVWLVAFGLSLVRAGWLMFAVGAIVYLAFSPRRVSLLATLGLTAALFSALIVVLPSAIGNDSLVTSFGNRLATLSDLDNDTSGKQRANLYEQANNLVWIAPFGQGLGVLGTSTKLSASEATTNFDSGILARVVEMGIPGVVLYIAPLLLLAGCAIGAWNEGRRGNDIVVQSLAATAVGLAVAFAGQQLAGEASSLMYLLLWLIMCLTIRGRPNSQDLLALTVAKLEHRFA